MLEHLKAHDPAAIALVDPVAGVAVSYGELVERVEAAAGWLRSETGGGLVFLVATNAVPSVVLYLASLDAGCPVCLVDPGSVGKLDPLLAAYDPDLVLTPPEIELPDVPSTVPVAGGDYRAGFRGGQHTPRRFHPGLALLLPTSGSTGNPKLVRLTRANLLANASSIVRSLGIEPDDRAIQSLPMHYSFGLSLINSHLLAGAGVVLTPHSFLRKEFWEAFDATGCTAFAGVPYVYETLDRLRFDPARHPSLRTMTQAGGGLRPDLIEAFYRKALAAGSRFFVMYGQTEATARIAYVPWERLGEKIGSIGVPVPDGRLWLEPTADDGPSELVYGGPNVMLGYAESASDLERGDELGGVLHTGDLATVDAEGFFTLTGRLKRIAKLFGRRVNLQDIEHDLERRFPLAAMAFERAGGLRVCVAPREDLDLANVAADLARQFTIPPRSVVIERVATLPLTTSGKKDYRALE